MLFALPEYDAAARRIAFQAVEHLARTRSPLLNEIESTPVGALHPTRVSFDDQPNLVLRPIKVGGTFDVPIASVCEGDLEPLLISLDDLAGQQASTLLAGMFERLRDLIDATGNTVDAAGAPLSHELLLEMFEKLEIAFDERGEAQLALVTGPGMIVKIKALPPMSPEQQQAFDEMMARKRAAFEASQRRRRMRSSARREHATEAESVRLFRLDEYSEAADRVVDRWIDRRTDELAPSLREFPRLEVEHVRTSRMTLPDASVVRIEPVRREDGGRLNIREALVGRFDDLRVSLNGVAERRARRMVAFWEEMEARGLFGGAVAKGSGPPTWDSMMDGMEELALTFDEAGEPNIKIVAGSAAAPLLDSLGPRDAGQEQRWQELMTRKKEEARARERHRRMA